MKIVDSHHHFWDLEKFSYDDWMDPKSVLAVNFGPKDLHPLLTRAHVDATVVVTAHPSVDETKWLLEIAERTDFVSGVVGWVDLTDRKLGNVLDEFQKNHYFKGVRHNWEGEDDSSWLFSSGAMNGLIEVARRDLTYDFLVRPKNLSYIPRIMDKIPELRAVVDHIGKPDIKGRALEPWLSEMRLIASIEGMRCKVSGMVTEADHDNWVPDDLIPYVHHVLGMFGADRLMMGSDWPVSTLASPYETVISTAQRLFDSLSREEKESIFGNTCKDFYRLNI